METGLVKQSTFTTPRPADSPGLHRHSQMGARRAEYLLVIYPGGDLQEKLQEEVRRLDATIHAPLPQAHVGTQPLRDQLAVLRAAFESRA